MIRIAICDDDERHGKTIEERVSSFLIQNVRNAEATLYLQGQNLFFDISEGKYFDLLLCDIEMPDMDGMELVRRIKDYLPDIMVIFITGHIRYAVDAYELSIFRYIPKSELEMRLSQALSDAIGLLQLQMDQHYTIQTPTRYERIPLQRILHIRREGKNSLITQVGNRVTSVRKSLAQVYDELNSDDFIFADRGDIVNLLHVMSLKNGIAELKNGERIPVGPANLIEFKEKLFNFWGRRI